MLTLPTQESLRPYGKTLSRPDDRPANSKLAPLRKVPTLPVREILGHIPNQ